MTGVSEKRRVTGNTAKRYLLTAPTDNDIPSGYSYIYVIQAGGRGPVKLGYGNNPIWRLIQLQIGSWEELHLRGAVAVIDGDHKALEVAVHKAAKPKWIRGEWFSLEPLDAIGCILKAAHDIGCFVGTTLDARERTRERLLDELGESAERRRLELCRKLGID